MEKGEIKRKCRACFTCAAFTVIFLIVGVFFIENCTAGGGVIQCAMPNANTQGL